jgi:hypothetical protein
MLFKYFSSTLMVLVLLQLSACGAIGVNKNPDEIPVVVGQTTKSQVIEILGLPQDLVNERNGNQHLIYDDGTRLSGLCIGCGNVNAKSLVSHLSSGATVDSVEFVFDSSGILIGKYPE